MAGQNLGHLVRLEFQLDKKKKNEVSEVTQLKAHGGPSLILGTSMITEMSPGSCPLHVHACHGVNTHKWMHKGFKGEA